MKVQQELILHANIQATRDADSVNPDPSNSCFAPLQNVKGLPTALQGRSGFDTLCGIRR